MTPTLKTVLYVRVSTSEQTSAHQVTQARQAGFLFEDRHVITDHGVSGVSTKLRERDQGRRLYDLLQPGDTLLVRWVNRLGRDYRDVKGAIEEFLSLGVTVRTIINEMMFEPDHKLRDPMLRASRDAVLAFMSAMAEAEATAAREAREAGIAHAKASPDANTRYRGRKPTYTREDVARAREMLADGKGATAIAAATKLTRQMVYRLDDAETALTRWRA